MCAVLFVALLQPPSICFPCSDMEEDSGDRLFQTQKRDSLLSFPEMKSWSRSLSAGKNYVTLLDRLSE